MSNFLSIKFWLNTRPEALSTISFKVFVIFIGAMLVGAFISYLVKNRKKSLYTKIWQRFSSFFLTNFFLGLMFLFFTYELIPFLSARILVLLWAIGMLVWFVFIMRHILTIPKIKEEKEKEQEFKKYIP
ncbi:MAG: hypothetical protein V1867_05325 [Candidatus Falkowbacteria bacterium]